MERGGNLHCGNPLSSQMAATLTQAIRPTTLIESVALSERLGVRLTLATETFQHTGSFKFRAAYNVASRIKEDEVLTASSGNFGQAMAYACRLLNKQCTVIMPTTSAGVKIDGVRAHGAYVDLIDTTLKSRDERVAELAAQNPGAYVASPYDDPLVIEGNATLGAELAAANRCWDHIIVPVGGGGLISGVVTGLRKAGVNTEIVGAEPALGNKASRSLRSGQRVVDDSESATIADGARVVSLGRYNWEIIRQGVHGVVEVSERNICEGVRLLFLLANLKVEPTGALSLGAILERPQMFQGRAVCCVVTGGNVDLGVYCALLTANE